MHLIKYIVREALKMFGKLDFLCLWKVKIVDFNLQVVSRCIWPHGQFLHTTHATRKGGVVTFFTFAWQNRLISWGVTPDKIAT